MSQQGLRQASVRAESGTTLTYEGDWHALWDGQGIEEGTFNERMLIYCGEKLGVTYTNINDAMQALALDQGATNFGSMGTFDASIGPAYEAETETLVAAMAPAPDATRQGHINTLIAALKSGGVWTKLDLLYVHAAHDAQAARLNWKVPASYAMTAVNSPSFTIDRGYTGNGTTSYLSTGFAPSTNGVSYIQDSAHLGVWDRTNTVENVIQIGFDGTSGHMFSRYSGDICFSRINGSAGSVPNTGAGFVLGDRTGSGSITSYRNGASLGSVASTSVAVPAGTVTVCGAPFAPNFSTHEIAAASVGGTLTAGEHTAYYNAMAAYMTAVGA